MADEDMFAGLKKVKKTKKKVDFDELELDGASKPPAQAAPAPAPEPGPAAEATPVPAATPQPIVEDAVRPLESDAKLTLPENEELDFSDLKKKKKKKVAIDLDDVAPQEQANDTLSNAQELANGDSKAAVATDGAADAGLDDFADIKKLKKSKGKKSKFDMEAFERELAATEAADASKANDGGDDDGDVPDGNDLDEDVPEGENPFAKEGGAIDEEGKSMCEVAFERKAWIGSERDYHFDELLGRFYHLLHASHPGLSGAGKKRFTIPPPSMMRDGNKRSVFANVAEICKRMHRQPEHVIQYLFAELGTTGSVDGSGRLVIKGRFQQKGIEKVLRRYIGEYVTCKTCKSPDTLLDKDNRIYFVTCQSCQSRRSVASISSGFKAVMRRPKGVA